MGLTVDKIKEDGKYIYYRNKDKNLLRVIYIIVVTLFLVGLILKNSLIIYGLIGMFIMALIRVIEGWKIIVWTFFHREHSVENKKGYVIYKLRK